MMSIYGEMSMYENKNIHRCSNSHSCSPFPTPLCSPQLNRCRGVQPAEEVNIGRKSGSELVTNQLNVVNKSPALILNRT